MIENRPVTLQEEMIDLRKCLTLNQIHLDIFYVLIFLFISTFTAICIITDCKDTKIWMIARHGTRLPSAKDIIGMNTTLKDLKFEILLAHQQGKGIGKISIL